MKRPGQIRRRGRRRTRRDREEGQFWRLELGPCEVCPGEGGECAGPVQGHHVIAKQALRKRGLVAKMWDRRNRLSVCEHRHEQATTKAKPIPRSLLPQSALDFAEELGLGWYIERHYPC